MAIVNHRLGAGLPTGPLQTLPRNARPAGKSAPRMPQRVLPARQKVVLRAPRQQAQSKPRTTTTIFSKPAAKASAPTTTIFAKKPGAPLRPRGGVTPQRPGPANTSIVPREAASFDEGGGGGGSTDLAPEIVAPPPEEGAAPNSMPAWLPVAGIAAGAVLLVTVWLRRRS